MGLFPISFVFSPFLRHMNIQVTKKVCVCVEGERNKGHCSSFDLSKIIYTEVIHPQRGHVLWLKPGKDYSK